MSTSGIPKRRSSVSNVGLLRKQSSDIGPTTTSSKTPIFQFKRYHASFDESQRDSPKPRGTNLETLKENEDKSPSPAPFISASSPSSSNNASPLTPRPNRRRSSVSGALASPTPSPLSSKSVSRTTDSVSHPSASEGMNAIREVKRLKVQLADKEKQLTSVERQLIEKDATIETLQKEGQKYKYMSKDLSREAKRLMFSQELKARKQNLEINRISSQLEKQENKIRRKKLERQELQEELERIEEFYEMQAAQFNEEMIAMREESNAAVQEATDRAFNLEREVNALQAEKAQREMKGVGGTTVDGEDVESLKKALASAVAENQRYLMLLDGGEMYLDFEKPGKPLDAESQQQVDIIQSQAKELQAMVEKLELQRLDDQAKIERLEASEVQNQALIHRFELYVQESQSEILLLELGNKDHLAHIARLESGAEDNQAEIKAMEALCAEAQAKIDRLQESLSESTLEVQQLRLYSEQNGAEVARLRNENSQSMYTANISTTELTPDNCLPIISRLETALKDAQNEIQAVTAASSSQELRIEHYAAVSKEQQTKISRMESALKESQGEVQRLQMECDNNQHHISKLEIALEGSKSQVAQTELALKTADRQLKVSDMATTACRAQIASLEAELAALNSEHVRLRFDMFSQTSALAASNAKYAAANSKMNLQLREQTGSTPPKGSSPPPMPPI